MGAAVAELVEEDNSSGLAKLIELGLDPDCKLTGFGTKETFTILEYACYLQKEKCIGTLVTHGADVKKQGNTGKYPIEILLEKKREDLAKLLALNSPALDMKTVIEKLAFRLLVNSAERERSREVFIFINGEFPSQPLARLLRGVGYRLRTEPTNQTLPTMVLNIEPSTKAGENLIRFHLEQGGPLEGGVSEGTFVKKFGHWILIDSRSSDK